jgi:hypothetical protein
MGRGRALAVDKLSAQVHAGQRGFLPIGLLPEDHVGERHSHRRPGCSAPKQHSRPTSIQGIARCPLSPSPGKIYPPIGPTPRHLQRDEVVSSDAAGKDKARSAVQDTSKSVGPCHRDTSSGRNSLAFIDISASNTACNSSGTIGEARASAPRFDRKR